MSGFRFKGIRGLEAETSKAWGLRLDEKSACGVLKLSLGRVLVCRDQGLECKAQIFGALL